MGCSVEVGGSKKQDMNEVEMVSRRSDRGEQGAEESSDITRVKYVLQQHRASRARYCQRGILHIIDLPMHVDQSDPKGR